MAAVTSKRFAVAADRARATIWLIWGRRQLFHFLRRF
jgi:hypothetical protein